ncbi:hypothetical protein HPB47_011816 [Ixodes persulcatus]|uniref:Uncharacterized protein n=1 Tax=Ixodes persulcatus TaxID=34615 RepID=A0AC60NVD9_IXOPE|nr:hypothetical protein HPB47_011816 [Ixodes persulcatus]
MVWFQKFEYAMGHWLQKATEHMIGCVLCSPGCFSLFRAKALMDDNVIGKYKTRLDVARHIVQCDQGEDRWLCTLLLQRGYRVAYCAASDAYTHCPEGYGEFFTQRRRWAPSTLANLLDLLENYKHIVAINDNVSFGYIVYQAMLMIGNLLGPGTIFLIMVSAVASTFNIPNWASLALNTVPILAFTIVCFTTKNSIQLTDGVSLSELQSTHLTDSVTADAHLTPSEPKETYFKLRDVQNVLIADTYQPSGQEKLQQTTKLTIANRDYAVTSYPSAPTNSCKGVIHGVASLTAPYQLIANIKSNVPVLTARMMGKTETALITFEGTYVPCTIYYRRLRFRCRPHKSKSQQCQNCLQLGHRVEVCPKKGKITVCDICYQENMTSDTLHDCVPYCVSCKEEPASEDTNCPAKKQADAQVTLCAYKRRAQQRPKAATIPNTLRTPPPPPKPKGGKASATPSPPHQPTPPSDKLPTANSRQENYRLPSHSTRLNSATSQDSESQPQQQGERATPFHITPDTLIPTQIHTPTHYCIRHVQTSTSRCQAYTNHPKHSTSNKRSTRNSTHGHLTSASQPDTPQVSVELKQIMLVLKNIQERMAALEQDVAELKAQGPQHPKRKADDPYHPESKIPPSLTQYLNTLDRKPDVILLQNTQGTHNLPQYTPYTQPSITQTDRRQNIYTPTLVTTYISKERPSIQLNTTDINTAHQEHVIITLQPRNCPNSITIVNAYWLGYFNSPNVFRGYPNTQHNGRLLEQATAQTSTTLANDTTQPTRTGNSVERDTNPDLAFHHGPSVTEWSASDEQLGGDHRLIHLTLIANVKQNQLTTENWLQLCDSLNGQLGTKKTWRILRTLLTPSQPRDPLTRIMLASKITSHELEQKLRDTFFLPPTDTPHTPEFPTPPLDPCDMDAPFPLNELKRALDSLE